MLKRIMVYAGPEKKKTVLATVLIFAAVLMQVLPFLLAYQLIAPLVLGQGLLPEDIFRNVGAILLCLVLYGVLYTLGLSVSHEAAFGILEKIRISMQKKMENQPLGVIQERGVGMIKRLFVDDVESMEALLAHAIPEGFGNVLIPVVVYVVMFFADWKLALMSLFSVATGMVAMMKMYRIGMEDMDNYYRAGKAMNNTIIEYINGMEVVKVFGKDGESFARFQRDVKNYRDFTLAWYQACWPWMALYNSLVPCTILLTLPLGSFFVLQGYASLTDLILVLCLSLSVGMPMLKALGFLPQFPQLDFKLQQLEQMIAAEPLRQTADAFCGRDHSVTFENVEFAYEETTVLKGINLTLREGQTTALVGESGSGKSTLAKLLVHYYDVNRGTIRIGGQDICGMSLEALNQQISYVAQEQFLFNTSLLENIRMGRPGATDEEVFAAAERAQCMEFIEKLPEGIRTLAGDGGKQLSGGQRQRIALARAIIKDAPIVVLDEATAFTDPENEEKMNAAIREVVRGKTLLVIAHKLPSVRNAEQICVMEQGRIAAVGTHGELLESSREYRKLWKASMESAAWRVGAGERPEDTPAEAATGQEAVNAENCGAMERSGE